MIKNYEDICALCECFQRMNPAEKDSTNQVDRMMHSIDTGKLVLPDNPVIAEWAHEKRSQK